MQREAESFAYDPHSPFTTPFTLISTVRSRFLSKPLDQPFFYQVYCPLSCKKVKIGLHKVNKVEALEFNTTTNRTVSIFANENIRYLVNKFKPNKKDKKTAPGQDWCACVDVEDKGNIAIFNPYCINAFQPLSFYTSNKIGAIEKPELVMNFQEYFPENCEVYQLGGKNIFLSKDLKWIGHNSFFNEDYEKQIFIFDPLDTNKISPIPTKETVKQAENFLSFWLWELQKIIDLETKDIEIQQEMDFKYNLDIIYENIQYYLNILEQIRARLMSAGAKKLSASLFRYHPRLYSAFQRLSSFFNYGNTKYDIIKLADLGFYNQTDMLQDLSYVQLPSQEIPTAETENVSSQAQLRDRLFPFCRMTRGLPFPNVPLATVLRSLPTQKISNNGSVVAKSLIDPYAAFATDSGIISVWSCEMMLYKMFEINIGKEYKNVSSDNPIPVTEKEKQLLTESLEVSEIDALFSTEPVSSPPIELPKKEEEQLKPDQAMLEQIIMMGYGPSTVKKALLQVKNESVVAALDAIQQIQSEEKAKNKKKIDKSWSCNVCTYFNQPGQETCEICGQVGNVVNEQQQLQKKQIEAELAAEEKRKEEEIQNKKKEEEEQRLKIELEKKQKEQELLKRQEIFRNSHITSVSLIRVLESPVAPFFIATLLRKQDGGQMLRVFRVGLSKCQLLKFYRIEGNYIVSNFTRKVYNQKNLNAISQILSESRAQIQWGIKLIEPSSNKDWQVIDSCMMEIANQVDEVRCEKSCINLIKEGQIIESYQIEVNDLLEKLSFTLKQKGFQKIPSQNLKPQTSVREVALASEQKKQIEIDEKVEEILIEVVEHTPAGQWNWRKKLENIEPPSPIYAENLIMSEFLPLKVECFEGSLFSAKYASTSILEKTNIFISNYPNASFVFKSIDNHSMLIQTVSIISSNNKLQKIYSINEGLIFTANELSWFSIAKQKFSKMNKLDYEEWMKNKIETNSKPAFWEPVAYFQVTNQIEFQIAFKRVAKYIFFLPTGINRKEIKDEVIAVKIDFFGVKGRIEDYDVDADMDQLYASEGYPHCNVEISQLKEKQKWEAYDESNYLARKSIHPNTYLYGPSYKSKFLQKIPLSVTSIFELKFKNLGNKKKISINSDCFKSLRVLKIKESKDNESYEEIKSFKELISVQNKLGGFEIQSIVSKLDITDLILSILEGPQDLTSYENLLNKILKLPDYDKIVAKVMSDILPRLCEKQIHVSEVGFRSFIRVYQKMIFVDEGLAKDVIVKSWDNVTHFVNTIRNKNYNILRNTYQIEELVLEPALFSKDYYRLIHPNYVEEDKVMSMTSEPQTPINNRVYIDTITNFNNVYYIDTVGHDKIDKIDLYFPKLPHINRYKMSLKIVELSTESGQLEEKQVYYRYFHEDTLLQLSSYAFKDTEIYKKTQINFLSIPGNILTNKSRVIKLYFDFLILTTIPHNRFKDLSEPCIILPLITSKSNQVKPVYEPLPKQLEQILANFPTETKHNSSQQRMPPHRYANQNNKMMYVVHEFKSKFTEENKSQFTETIDKITQNILDANIVEECVKTLRISEYQLEYKGLDFAYTLMITLMKMMRKLPSNFTVSVETMFNLFDTYIVYEKGPIMTITASTLQELYKRLSPDQQSFFIERTIDNYLLDAEKIKNLKISDKYPIEKILKFLYDFNLPTAMLFEKLAASQSIFSITILIKLILKNVEKYGLGPLEVYSEKEMVKKVTIHQLIEISFNTCIWILDHSSSSISSQILSQAFDLFLKFFPNADEKDTSSQEAKLRATLYDSKEIKIFTESIDLKNFWKLVFLTLRMKNESLKQKIHNIFKILIENKTEKFQKSINNMLLEIIRKEDDSLYLEINPNVTDDVRMNHLQTILEYLSLTKSELFLDTDTAKCLLSLPLTPTLWSLTLKIIPREDEILLQILKNFKSEYYSSLGKQIMEFCEPLTGIKALESNHINWLELVREIRVEGKSMVELFIKQLKKCNFGGKNALMMAVTEDVKNLEISCEFAKLIMDNKLEIAAFTNENIEGLVSWFFVNYTTDAGQSPATDLIKTLSQFVYKIFQKVTKSSELIPKFIRAALEIRKEGEIVEKLFEQKRMSSSNALNLNKKFCECFETLINLLCVNDEMHDYFVFECDGLKYLHDKVGLGEGSNQMQTNDQSQPLISTQPQEQLLLSEGLVVCAAVNSPQVNEKGSSIFELKEEEFANNVKLVPDMNSQGITCSSVDWTANKKGNKTKILFLPMNNETFYEYPLYVSFTNACEVRSIKVGFPAASYQFTDKLVASPSSVTVEGSMDLKCFEPMGEMEKIDDDGYSTNGVVVFVINFQKINRFSINLTEALSELVCHRIKYLKIIVKRPVVSFIEGQYSPLNGKPYKNLGSSISFLSVMGDAIQKLPFRLLNSCQQLSKQSSLTILNSIINQSNPQTTKKIANSTSFVNSFKKNFDVVKEHMKNYPSIVPNIVYVLGSNNEQLGDWLIDKFLSDGNEESQATIINQIITSSSEKIFERLDIFLKNILKKLARINRETDIESGIMYANSVSFIESFCKTLEEAYDIGFATESILHCQFANIEDIINLYDKKYSSPEIKTLIRLLISLLYLKEPLKLSDPNIMLETLNVVWKNCSEAKPYFYLLLSALLVHKRSAGWVVENDHEKVKILMTQINSSIEAGALKALGSQTYLLMIISEHEAEYLRKQKIHLQLYNRLKNLIYEDSQILDNITKFLQNIILGYPEEEEQMAKQLISDVKLLVKRKDPILLKFYVAVLGLQKQVYVNLQGFDADNSSAKKDSLLPTKILTKSQTKAINDKINKKIKFNLVLESDAMLTPAHYNTVYSSLNASQFLMLIKVKMGSGKYGFCGCYNPGRSFRSEEDSYCWEDVINYEKGSFVFWIDQGEIKFVENNENGQQMISLFGGEEGNNECLIIYENGAESIKIPFNSQGQATFSRPNWDGKIESIEFYNGSLKSQFIDSSKMLALSNKAKTPFSYYRHSTIYVFPARITIDKFMSIIGIKGHCKTHKKPVESETLLGQLSNNTEDLIVDLEIIPEESNEEKRQDEGYIPEMNIFDKFSSLGGVNEVLELGSQSIKDWKKPERKKSFEHYMSELKSFVHLPNFFNLFIKNQESVTFLFEVASGMPDDPNSTRNWEQDEVTSSKFIYKILSDIFKYDRSAKLRDMDKYEDFCEIILEKLAEISKQTVREFKVDEEDVVEVAEVLEKKKSEGNGQKKKKKGTGYGADSQNNSKWSASEWIDHRKNVSQEIQRVICIFVSFLDCEEPLVDPRLSEVIKNSCLLPLLESALRSGSLLDISKDAELFKNYLSIIKNLASNPATIDCVLDLDKGYKPTQVESIYTLLKKLNGIAEIFIDCLKSGKSGSENDVAAVIAVDIQKTYVFVDKAVKKLVNKKEAITIREIKNMPIAVAYRVLLSKLRFGYVDMKNKNNEYQHFYASTISSGHPSTAKILRLSQQLADLSSSLPCEHTNSIFVKCDKSRIDVIKILIMGSKDTPYSNGAFMFDLYCDDSYPNNPPKMSITTTGSGKIRFNPNLYSCGKVCLSLLGTWRGQASENWDPKLSTLLQLFISTQGITMSEDVYFNEPGFDSEQGTPEGDKKNEAYSNIVKLGNVRYAMIGQIKSPPKGFEEIINKHFYIKKKQILEEVEKWIEQAGTREASYTGLVSDHNSSWCSQLKVSKNKYMELLMKDYEELKQLLETIPEPSLQQKQEEVNFEMQKAKKKMRAKQAKLGEIDVSYDPEGQKQLEYEEGVMEDRWSRYIGAMGIEAVKKQAQSKVLLIGLKSLGLEIAKNLVLSGLKQLSIVENDILETGSEQHFYMSDLKGKRIEQCIYKLKDLNPYMTVKYQKQMPAVQNFNLVISTGTVEQSLLISEECRKHKIKFIHSETSGVSGLYFGDLGEEMIVSDVNGEESFEALIRSISCEQQGVVTLLEGVRHVYEDGDYIVIEKVEGMEIIEEIMNEPSEAQLLYNQMSKSKPNNSINGMVFKIKVINWNSFSIGNTKNFKPYVRNGLCRNIKMPKKLQFKSLKDCIANFEANLDSNLGIYDFEKMGDNFSIFISFQSLAIFKQTHARLPKNWEIKDIDQLEQIGLKLLKESKKQEKQIEDCLKFVRNFACIAEAQLSTISAYFGGLVSQEAIKALTGKYFPIKQFFTFHFNELAQKFPQEKQKLIEKQIKENEAFANLKMVIGRQNSVKIEEMKTFVIGAGAIGCQLLKNFAMINMGAQGVITVTDPDHIQTSNLTRQFLFRKKHVKNPKSATAAATLIQMNPLLKGHISARLDKVCEQTEQVYSDQFFDNQTVIANALDNVKARVYVDKRCVTNLKPLFESGTLGPKGHVQVIIPHKTENYGNQADPTEEHQIPHCTLKMFPQQTVHCIEWSRDIFGKVFTLNPKALKKVIESKDINAVEDQQRSTVIKMLENKPINFDDCVAEAVRKFYRYFRNNVKQLLHTYPLDMKNKEGKLFWQLPKRPPKQIPEINFEDETHQMFVASYSVILARVYSIPYPKDFRKPEGKKQIMSIAKKIKVQDFVPSEEESHKLQKMTENQEKQLNKKQEPLEVEEKMQEPEVEEPEVEEPKVEEPKVEEPKVEEPKVEEPKVEEPKSSQPSGVKLSSQDLELNIQPEQFEKDEDVNGHIDLIYSMSNLRARNYGLSECTWIEAKLKAGKIMAALSTTTSVVAALQTLEIMKLAIGSDKWRNAFVNLAVPLIQISEPGEAPKHKIGNSAFTIWDSWEFKCETLKDLLKQLQQKYEVEGYNISTSDGLPIYWQAMYKGKKQAKEALLVRPLKTMFSEETISLSILMRDLTEEKKSYEEVPQVKVHIV